MQSAKKRLRLGSACWLLLLALVALNTRAAFSATRSATRAVTDADNGSSIHLKIGDILEVYLRSNPATGYMWYLHPKSTPLLKLVGQSKTQVQQPGVGRPMFQLFRFQAVSAGDGVLLLHYIRAWEKPLPAEEQYVLHAAIR
ncbi:MAG TPA: protease inhibitor I42 family protein [Terracidiphilus sp.]|nr:protease inhibitor I42 family protein [Terracidiphilus sp.]